MIEIVVPYFKAGLENSEFCMWITSEPLDIEEAKMSLKKAVPDIDVYLEKGQIEIIPETDFYLVNGAFDSFKALNTGVEKLNHAIDNGYCGLRTGGNLSWLKKADWDNFTDYEEKIDSAIGTFKIISMCAYSLDNCSATDIIDAVTNHQFTLIKKEGRWEKIESSKRKKAEETAIQATKNWEYTFDSLPDLIAIIDNEYRIIRANRAMAARLGMEPEECTGLTCYRVIHGTDEPPSFCPHRQLIKDGLEHTAEVFEDFFKGYFLVSVSPLHDSEGKLIGSVHVARDINERKQAEDALRQSEQRIRLKLEKILSPVNDTDAFELAEVIDIPVIQSLIDDFYKLTSFPVGLNDLKGNVLACVGWQEICTRFHRVNPETCRHCIESDIELSTGAAPGEYRLYRCKNNLWDVVTPIMVAGQQVGKIFSGQFFFEDESLDYEFFRSQARKYGFDEDEYISALEKVPRLSRETVDAGMAFLMGFANILSQLSYGNLKLAQSLAERDSLVAALQESDGRFRSVLENSLDSAYRMDFQNNRFDYMSPVIEQITGFSAREINAMTSNNGLLNRIHSDDRPLVAQGSAQSLVEGFGAHEYRFKCRDGKYRWLADHFSIIKDKTGMTRYRAGIVRDITEKKYAEEALIRSENKFRALAENSPDIITRFDRQNRHIYANPAAAGPYCRSPEEIIGKTHTELGTNPENAKFFEEYHKKVFATGKPVTIEFQYISPQGRKYYVNTQLVPEFVDGKVASVLAISHDITDVKEAEIKLKETLDNLEKLVKERTAELEKAYDLLKESEKGLAEAQKMAHIGNWEWDIATDKAYWSEEMYRIFGRDAKKEAPSYNEYLGYIHPDDLEYYLNAIKTAETKGSFSIDHRIVRADGEERTVHQTSEFILNNKDIPVRIKGVIQDITERKKAEKTLMNLETARKKEIHHRIKNNLQVISSLLDLQAGKFRERKYIGSTEVLNAFRESQDRVVSIALIHEELHEIGKTNTLNFSPYLQRLIKNLFQTYSIGNADISLNIDLEEDTFFDMDTAVPLGLIVNELVSNSLKYAFQGRDKGIIRIRLSKEENEETVNDTPGSREMGHENTAFILTVSDNGTGMPEDFNMEKSSTLGIQLVTTLVDQLDGVLKINRDCGTEFIIRFTVPGRK
ncbi:PAS domain S-box protein [Methanosarcina hadiensis]|uniref:PAS domain S-box protein n=1 Tax=Methanosarcina hadiensis TaxID=3078083 RepID=UPI0039779FF7